VEVTRGFRRYHLAVYPERLVLGGGSLCAERVGAAVGLLFGVVGTFVGAAIGRRLDRRPVDRHEHHDVRAPSWIEIRPLHGIGGGRIRLADPAHRTVTLRWRNGDEVPNALRRAYGDRVRTTEPWKAALVLRVAGVVALLLALVVAPAMV
jgi:hypothetical protein